MNDISLFNQSSDNTIKFQQFQASRIQKRQQLNDSMRFEKDNQISLLQKQLEETISEVNILEAELANEEQDFITKKEALLTELNKIKIDSTIESSKLRINHLTTLDKMQETQTQILANYNNQISSFSAQKSDFLNSISNLQSTHDLNSSSSKLEETRKQLEKTQQIMRHNKLSQILESDSDSDEDNNSDELYDAKISQLQEEKELLLENMKNNEETNNLKIIELTEALDEQESSFKEQLFQLEKESKERENKYKDTLDGLFDELSSIQSQRSIEISKRKKQIQEMEKQIQDINKQFESQFRDAARVSEKLRTALLNAKIWKTQHLEMEKQRASENQRLSDETVILLQKISDTQKELQVAKDEYDQLKNAIIAKYGARRAASII